MIKLLLAILLLSGQAWANTSSGWYGTLQGNNSDIQSGSIPDGSTLQYNLSLGKWTFSYATVPAGGSTGYILTKNSNANYDYSWQPAGTASNITGLISAGTNITLSGNGTAGTPYVINSSGGGGSQSPWTGNINGAGYQLYSTGNIGIGSTNPGQALDVMGTIRTSSLIPTSPIGVGTTGILAYKTSDGTIVPTFQGTSLFTNTEYPSHYEIGIGTSGAPITTAGPTLKISRSDNTQLANCVNSSDSECNATLAVYASGSSTAGVETTGGYFYSYNTGTSSGVDAVGLLSIGEVDGTTNADGTGAYLQGSRYTSSGTVDGAEIRAANYTSSNCTYANSGLNSHDCVGLYLSNNGDGSNTTIMGSAMMIGNSDTKATWHAGITVNSGTLLDTAGMVLDDASNSGLYGLMEEGTHTYALVTARSSGNVGIGTIVPVNLLDVQGTVTNRAFEVTSAGNVGIGSTNPGQALDVHGTVRATGLIVSGNGNTSIGGNLSIGTTASANQLDVINGAAIGTTYAGYSVAPSSGVIIQGNVGIGTITPGGSLSVVGGVSIGNLGYSRATPPTNGLMVSGNIGVGSYVPGESMDVQGNARLNSSDQGSLNFILNNTSGSTYEIVGGIHNISQTGFDIYDVTNSVHALTVDSNHNVGINQSSPGQKLDVNGTVKAIGLITGNTNVGIGSSNPQFALDIQENTANSTSTGNIRLVATNQGRENIILQNTNGYTFYITGGIHNVADAGFDIYDISNSHHAITISGTSDNVGIGTYISGANLDIKGTVAPFRLQSPDGSHWTCQPANSTGVFGCSSS